MTKYSNDLSSYPFSTRVLNNFDWYNIKNIDDVLNINWKEFSRLRNVGKKAKEEIIKFLEPLGEIYNNSKFKASLIYPTENEKKVNDLKASIRCREYRISRLNNEISLLKEKIEKLEDNK